MAAPPSKFLSSVTTALADLSVWLVEVHNQEVSELRAEVERETAAAYQEELLRLKMETKRIQASKPCCEQDGQASPEPPLRGAHEATDPPASRDAVVDLDCALVLPEPWKSSPAQQPQDGSVSGKEVEAEGQGQGPPENLRDGPNSELGTSGEVASNGHSLTVAQTPPRKWRASLAEAPEKTMQELLLQGTWRVMPTFKVVLLCCEHTSDVERFVSQLTLHSEVRLFGTWNIIPEMLSNLACMLLNKATPHEDIVALFENNLQGHQSKWELHRVVKYQQSIVRRLVQTLADGTAPFHAVASMLDVLIGRRTRTGNTLVLRNTAVSGDCLALARLIYPGMRIIHCMRDEQDLSAEGIQGCIDWGRTYPRHYLGLSCSKICDVSEDELGAILAFMELPDQARAMLRLYKQHGGSGTSKIQR